MDLDLNPTSGEFTSVASLNAIRGRVGGKNPLSLGRSGSWPVFTGSTRVEREFTVEHRIGESAVEDYLQLLEGMVYSQKYGALLLTFEEEGIDKTAFVTTRDMEASSSNNAGACADLGLYTGTWILYEQHYHAADPTLTGAVETAGDTTVVAVDVRGTIHTERVAITLTPTGLKDTADGQQWRIQYTIVNVEPRPVVNHPVEITDNALGASLSNGINHAALVAGGDSLANGDDVESYQQLRLIPRWTFPTDRTWDEADTGVVSNLSLPPRRRWTVRTGILAGDTVVTVKELRDLKNLPAPVPFLAARITAATQDVVLVTAVDDVTGTLTIERGARGTTAAAWSAGDFLYWAPREGCIDLVGGHLGALPPLVDDSEKPCTLDPGGNSSNARFVWADYYETGISGDTQRRLGRSAGWYSRSMGKYDREKKTGDGDMYWRHIASDTGDPAPSVGIEYRADGRLGGQPLIDRWEWMSAIPFDDLTFDLVVTLEFAADREARVGVFVYDLDGNEILLDTYDAGTHTSENFALATPALGVSVRTLPFVPKIDGSPNIVAGEPVEGRGWVLSGVSVNFPTASQIVSIIGGQEPVYQFGRPDAPASIQNSDGDTLYLYGILCPVDGTVVIDIEAGSVTVDDEPATHLVAGTFPPLPPRHDVYPAVGPVALTYQEDGAAGVQIAVEHADCWN